MDVLPLEICLRILDFIPSGQWNNLRLVSRRFNQLVLRQFKSINFLQFVPESSGYVHPDLIDDLFDFRKLVVNLKDKQDPSEALEYFRKRCSIKAIDFQLIRPSVKLSSIVDVAPDLVYIRAFAIEIDGEPRTDDQIINLFPSLLGFNIARPERPFCLNLWFEKGRSLIQWSDYCYHTFACTQPENIPESVRCVKLIPSNLFSKHIDRLDWLTTASSLQVLKIHNHQPPVPLRLSNLKCFYLILDEVNLDMSILHNYLHHSTKLKHLNLLGTIEYDTSVSLLFFINSLSHLSSLKLDLHVGKPTVADKTSSLFIANSGNFSKSRLKNVQIRFDPLFSVTHLQLITQMINSSRVMRDFELSFYGAVPNTLRFDATRERLFASATYISQLNKLWTAVTDYRNRIKSLQLQAGSLGFDFVRSIEAILLLENLQTFDCQTPEAFVDRWLPLFTKSQKNKSIHFLFRWKRPGEQVLSHKTHALIRKSINSGRISQFTSHWKCPLRSPCPCGLRRVQRKRDENCISS